jgi:iron complex outermembrane receptor protein
MQRFCLVVAILISGLASTAQYTFRAKIVNKETSEPVAGASVGIETLKMISIADSAGHVLIQNIPAGKYLIKISSVGFAECSDNRNGN